MKKRRFSIKHPLLLSLCFPLIVLFGGTAIMLHIDRIYDLPDYANAIAGIGITVLSLIWLIVFLKNFSKIMRREEKTQIKKIKKYAFSNKSFVLIQKINLVANLSLLFGGLSVYVAWLIFLPVARFGHYGYWIFRAVSIFVTAFGFVFSFITPKKMLVYKNGELIISSTERTLTIKPSELIDYKKIPSNPGDNNWARQAMFCDVVLYLPDAEILLKKADCNLFLNNILKAVKK